MPNIYNSKFAAFVGSFLDAKDFAITINQTTYYSCERDVVDEKWRCHEDRHKDQWAELGPFRFVLVYTAFLVRYGYEKNPLEIDAHDRSYDYKKTGYFAKPD